MRFRHAQQNLLVATLMLLMAAIPFSLSAKDTQKTRKDSSPGAVFLPSKNAMADLATTLKQAKSEHKLALIIMGANWCHDSKALAARLQLEPLKSLVEERYETLFVNVGNFTAGRDVIQSLGVPIYYATPTILIVDPVSGLLVNNGNRRMWSNAASISMEDSISYFQSVADTDLSTLPNALDYNAEQLQLFAEIDEFEQAQAARLKEAYAIIGPMIEENFDSAIWQEVGKYRNNVAADVDGLRATAAQRIAAGETDIVLPFPTYPPWSWSTEAQSAERF